MLYSTRRVVLSLALSYLVSVVCSLFSIAITSLGEERANLNAFCTFVRFSLLWFCLFSLPLGVGKGSGVGSGGGWEVWGMKKSRIQAIEKESSSHMTAKTC